MLLFIVSWTNRDACTNWIHLAQDNTQWRTLVNTVMRITIVWDVRPCSVVVLHQCFGRKHCLHQMFALCMLVLFFSSEDRGSMFLWNAGEFLSEYAALLLRKHYSSQWSLWESQIEHGNETLDPVKGREFFFFHWISNYQLLTDGSTL
jgi:hypothetical protein